MHNTVLTEQEKTDLDTALASETDSGYAAVQMEMLSKSARIYGKDSPLYKDLKDRFIAEDANRPRGT